MMLEAIEGAIEAEANRRYGEFLREFLDRSLGTPTGSVEAALRTLKECRLSTLPRLRRLVSECRDSELAELVKRYQEIQERFGFYEDGGGGPRFVATMPPGELQGVKENLRKVYEPLRMKVQQIRRSNAAESRSRILRCYLEKNRG
jgi:hypothetical protein